VVGGIGVSIFRDAVESEDVAGGIGVAISFGGIAGTFEFGRGLPIAGSASRSCEFAFLGDELALSINGVTNSLSIPR
jgi:hypothetical protein